MIYQDLKIVKEANVAKEANVVKEVNVEVEETMKTCRVSLSILAERTI